MQGNTLNGNHDDLSRVCYTSAVMWVMFAVPSRPPWLKKTAGFSLVGFR